MSRTSEKSRPLARLPAVKDFRSPRRVLPEIQDYYNRKGLFSDKGEKKKAFYILKQWYDSK